MMFVNDHLCSRKIHKTDRVILKQFSKLNWSQKKREYLINIWVDQLKY